MEPQAMSTEELLRVRKSILEAIDGDCYGVDDFRILLHVESEVNYPLLK